MTHTEAFESALWLAVTATTDERTRKALLLADELASGLTETQIKTAMAMVEKRLEAGHEH